MLEIFALGTVQISVDSLPLSTRIGLHRALLLVYLAEADGPETREHMAGLLWPGIDDVQARGNLRKLVLRMRSEGFEPYLEIRRNTIALNWDAPIRYDLAELRGLTRAPERASLAQLTAAEALYRGAFLTDEGIDEFPALASWADAVRIEWEMRMARVLFHLAQALRAQGAAGYAEAVRVGEKLIGLAPFDDQAQLLYMDALADDGQIAAAKQAYDAYDALMRAEFDDYEPSPELLAFAARFSKRTRNLDLAREPTGPITDRDAADARATHRTGEKANATTPAQSGPTIIGRTAEAARLTALLDQGARLISVTGLGGIGKTSFVRSQLPPLRARFDGRLHLIDLRGEEQAGADAATAVFQAIAGALALTPQNDVPLEAQVQAALATAPVCLILDNFETLHDAALTVARLVDQTPTLTVITTSRQALYTKREALVELGGLRIAGDGGRISGGRGAASEEAGWSEGATLFLQRAAQQRVGFDRTAVDRAEVEALCAQLGGHPLAIELAAAQLDFYGLEELLASTHTEVDVLATGQGDLPGDHDNLTLLLARMWAPLSPQAQAVLARLSVFAGAFHREAMMAVVPASMQIYRELRNASLLQSMDEPAWFSLHPLVKQAAAARLATDAAGHADAQTRHARHYLEFLDLGDEPLEMRHIREPAVWSRLQRTVADLHLAWVWALQTADWARLAQAITSFVHLHRLNRQYKRGYALLDELMQALPPEPQWSSLQTQLAGRAALFLSLLGVLDGALTAAKPWIERAVTWLDAAGTAHDQAMARYHAGLRATYFQEEWVDARTLLAQGLAIAQQNELPVLIANIQLLRALIVHLPTGQWNAAVDGVHQAMTSHARAYPGAGSQNDAFLSNCIIVLVSCLHMGEAERILTTMGSTSAQPPHKLKGGESTTSLLMRCTLLAHRGELDEAIAAMQETVRLYTEEHTGQASLAYGLLALCQSRRGDMDEAVATARQGLEHIKALGGRYLLRYAQQRLAEVLLLAEDFAPVAHKDEVLALLEQALAAGLEFEDVPLIFSALYALVHARRAEIPPALFERMIKIGACSPALYYELHPIGRARLAVEGIVLTDEEADVLYDTDLVQVKALATEINAYLS